MNWWKRNRKVYLDPRQGQEAVAARRAAENDWPEVERAARELAHIRARNHFVERLSVALEARKGSA